MSGEARNIEAQPHVRVGLMGSVVKKSHLKFLDEGQAYLKECHRHGNSIIEDARTKSADITAQAHEKGYARGRRDGETSVLQHGYFKALILASIEEQITDIVRIALRRLIGELGEDRALFLLAAEAVRDKLSDQIITLKGRTDQVAVIERDIAARLDCRDTLPGIRIMADSRYPEGEIIADIGPECLKFTLDAAIEAIHRAIDDALLGNDLAAKDDDTEQAHM